MKAIAKFYCVTIDELLSGEEVLSLAEEAQKQHSLAFRNLVFGLLDLSACAYLFLPLFAARHPDGIQAVSLLALSGVSPYLRIIYAVLVIGMILRGIVALALPDRKVPVSLGLSVTGTLLFIISSQPYAAAFGFLILGIKVFLLVKKQ